MNYVSIPFLLLVFQSNFFLLQFWLCHVNFFPFPPPFCMQDDREVLGNREQREERKGRSRKWLRRLRQVMREREREEENPVGRIQDTELITLVSMWAENPFSIIANHVKGNSYGENPGKGFSSKLQSHFTWIVVRASKRSVQLEMG